MGFDKTFFDEFNERLKKYQGHFGAGMFSVILRVGYDREFSVYRFIDSDDAFLSFAHYDKKKLRPLSEKAAAEQMENYAYPVVTIPYQAIQWVEINPGAAEGTRDAGFQM